jgi:hypothetical protein
LISLLRAIMYLVGLNALYDQHSLSGTHCLS